MSRTHVCPNFCIFHGHIPFLISWSNSIFVNTAAVRRERTRGRGNPTGSFAMKLLISQDATYTLPHTITPLTQQTSFTKDPRIIMILDECKTTISFFVSCGSGHAFIAAQNVSSYTTTCMKRGEGAPTTPQAPKLGSDLLHPPTRARSSAFLDEMPLTKLLDEGGAHEGLLDMKGSYVLPAPRVLSYSLLSSHPSTCPDTLYLTAHSSRFIIWFFFSRSRNSILDEPFNRNSALRINGWVKFSRKCPPRATQIPSENGPNIYCLSDFILVCRMNCQLLVLGS
jgi:hypothetical protein